MASQPEAMMSKVVTVVLLACALAAVGCGDEKKGDAKPAGTTAATATAKAAAPAKAPAPAKSAEPGGGW